MRFTEADGRTMTRLVTDSFTHTRQDQGNPRDWLNPAP